VIPGDNPVIQTQRHIGDGEVVVAGSGEPLQHCPPVVADVARDPSLEGRQAGNGRGWRRRKKITGNRQCISRNGPPLTGGWPADLGDQALAADDDGGICGKEGILGIAVLVSGAVQEDEARQIGKSSGHVDRIESSCHGLD
jgi:hypothetical protein